MKKAFSSYLLLVGIIMCFVQCKQKPAVINIPLKPNETFHLMKNYPDGELGMAAKGKILKELALVQSNSLMSKRSGSVWQQHGPYNIGGRVNTIAVNPLNSEEVLIGNAAGGIFKTSDDGKTWRPVFDEHNYLAIGDIEYHPSQKDVVFAGTGDLNIGGYVQLGNGVYKSSDAGEHWNYTGLEECGIISKICISKDNSEVVYAAAMGNPFIKDNHRGLYKSTDGGKNWKQVLFLHTTAGIIDMVMHPHGSDTLFVAGWNRERTYYSSIAAGKHGKVYRTTDGGVSWDTLSIDSNVDEMSRIGLAFSKEEIPVLWVQMVNAQSFETHGVYHSSDLGETFKQKPAANLEDVLGGFGWYFGKIRVNPWNAKEIFVLGVDLWKSENGGYMFDRNTPQWQTYEVHADKHDLVFIDSSTMLLATDGGVYKTSNGGENWSDYDNIPNTQFYRIAADPHNPGYYAGGAQDNGTSYGNKDMEQWVKVFGGDGFQPTFSPDNPNLIYCETQWGGMYGIELKEPLSSGEFVPSSYYEFTNGLEDDARKCWDMPVRLSPVKSTTAYTGTHRVFKREEAPLGIWEPISTDLTTGVNSPYHVITSIDPSVFDENSLMVGTSDGKVHRYDGVSWYDISEGLPERYVTDVKMSSSNANCLFISHSGYRSNEYIPHLHMSEDNGQTWEDISGNLPPLGVNDIELIKGYNDNIIFAATDGGVYHTLNKGKTWERTGEDMPIIAVYDIVYDSLMNQLAAGTFARSLMTLPIQPILDEYVGYDEETVESLVVYPNPVQDFMQIEYKHQTGDLLKIVDLQGKLAYEKEIADSEAINLSELGSGTYVANIYRKGMCIASKTVIKIP